MVSILTSKREGNHLRIRGEHRLLPVRLFVELPCPLAGAEVIATACIWTQLSLRPRVIASSAVRYLGMKKPFSGGVWVWKTSADSLAQQVKCGSVALRSQ